ncbi:MAG: hypothetical protein GWP10_08250 [Nitrospiraceae bacterium]|nr:hypothetical protein [Nitrospiraceae bacterium]
MDEQELTGMERYEEAVRLLSDILDCGTRDIDIILDLLRKHGWENVMDHTTEYLDYTGAEWSFGAFICGIEETVVDKLHDRLEQGLYDAISTVTLDTNYATWGRVAYYGDAKVEVGDVFAEMCREGITDERVERLIQAYEDTIGIGGYDDTK